MNSAQLSGPAARAASAGKAEPPRAVPGSSRELLLRAMVRTVARHGYAGASVSRVVAEAKVSRAAFYEHFANRE